MNRWNINGNVYRKCSNSFSGTCFMSTMPPSESTSPSGDARDVAQVGDGAVVHRTHWESIGELNSTL